MNSRIHTYAYMALAFASLLVIFFLIGAVMSRLESGSQISTSSQVALVSGAGSGLVGWWQFDEGAGSAAADAAGSNSGTLTNSPSWVAGKIGNWALSFNGSNQYVSLGSAPSLADLGADTFSAWVYVTSSSGNRVIIDKGARHFLRLDTGNAVRYDVAYGNDEARVSVDNAVPLNTWTHIVATDVGGTSASNIHIYVNGTEVSYAQSIDGTGSRNSDMGYEARIGNGLYGGAFVGYIDDVRVYNRALSPSEVSELYAYTGTAGAPDTQAPSVPQGLSASAVSSSQVNLTWTASTDNTAVAGYRVYRNGAQIASVVTASYSDTNLSAATSYAYTVLAYDAAGNNSAQSSSVMATTQAAAAQTYSLTISKSGTGSGTVTGGSISCGSSCSQSGITSGTQVTLSAVPASGSTFSGWGGACSGTGSCALTISADTVVTAAFSLQQQQQDTSCSAANVKCVPSEYSTIQACANAAQPGDTCLIGAGTYTEFVRPPQSGTAGNMITFKGTRGSNGEYLTIIDPSTPISTGWVAAPEIGAGVYKKTDVPFETHELTIDYKRVPFVWNMGDMTTAIGNSFRDYTGAQTGAGLLAQPANATFTSAFTSKPIGFWDGVEALWGASGNITYLRLRNGGNPNGMNIHAAPNTPGSLSTYRLSSSDINKPAVDLTGASYIDIRDLNIRGAFGGVLVDSGNNNIIESNKIMNGYAAVTLATGASQNIVRNNDMTDTFYGYSDPGAWGNGSAYSYQIRSYNYVVSKFFMGDSSEFGQIMSMVNAGSGNQIYGNHIHDGFATGFGIRGIVSNPTSDTDIHDNVLEKVSSAGLLFMEGHTRTYIHDNTFSDTNINMRFHHYDYDGETNRIVYYYRNKSWLPDNVGWHIYVHLFNSTPSVYQPEFWVYQNSFSGGQAGFAPSAYVSGNGGLPHFRFLNNIFSGTQYLLTYDPLYMTGTNMMGIFDYNIITPPLVTYPSTADPVWFGAHNIKLSSAIWSVLGVPDFSLSAGSPAINAGIDLSRSFTIGGATYPALPGMSPGYFSGTAPDIGASEYGGQVVTPPSPTPVAGICSTTLNQCTAGTFSNVADTSTNYLWQCIGTNGGATAMCSLPISVTQPPAQGTTTTSTTTTTTTSTSTTTTTNGGATGGGTTSGNTGGTSSSGGGGGGGGGGVVVTPALSITNISISGKASGVTISWTTNRPATSQIVYGLTISYGSQTTFDSTYVSSHVQVLKGLGSNKLYHMQVRSKDASGALAVSSDITFTVTPQGTASLLQPTIATQTFYSAQTTSPSNPSVSFTSSPITQTLSYGMTSPQVKDVQRILNYSGYTVASSGAGSVGQETNYFGSATAAALKKFQCAKSIVCSGDPTTTGYGSTGPRTRTALNSLRGSTSSTSSAPAAAASSGTITAWLTFGTINSQVQLLQQKLNAAGYAIASSGNGSPGHETTYFDAATLAALQKFQCAKLSVCSGSPDTTGYGATGPRTRAALNGK